MGMHRVSERALTTDWVPPTRPGLEHNPRLSTSASRRAAEESGASNMGELSGRRRTTVRAPWDTDSESEEEEEEEEEECSRLVVPHEETGPQCLELGPDEDGEEGDGLDLLTRVEGPITNAWVPPTHSGLEHSEPVAIPSSTGSPWEDSEPEEDVVI